MIVLKIAGLPIGVDNRYEHIVGQAEEYLTDEEPLFTVLATDEDLEAERKAAEGSFPDYYLEFISVYRKIAERLYKYDAFVFHGAVIAVDGVAYAFAARSGVGKTTHTGRWVSEFPDAHYLNGDKPIIRFIDGVPYACGTPWRGKENFGKNEMLPLEGIAFLKRGAENEARSIPPSDAVDRLMLQVFLPKNGEALLSTMGLCDKLLSGTQLIELSCNMNPEAAHVCRSAFKNKV